MTRCSRCDDYIPDFTTETCNNLDCPHRPPGGYFRDDEEEEEPDVHVDQAAGLEAARLDAQDRGVADVAMIHICQGPPRCDYDGTDPDRVLPCAICVSVRADDPRTTEQILVEMNRVQ